MKKLLDQIQSVVKIGFAEAGYDDSYAACSVSARPDLCEYQCNGAMALAKKYHKAPLIIAEEVAGILEKESCFSEVTAAKPGFINFRLDEAYLASYLNKMKGQEKFGIEPKSRPEKIVIDYGGPNVAKPLHVGHLRSAIIGESLKRIFRYAGDEVTGDIHMGDWGLQMGLIITELKERKPDLPYFDPSFAGEYPSEAPFTISELEEIYPAASARSKEDEEYYARALEATRLLQEGDPGCRALWDHIIRVSVTDLKKNYEKLDVSFDLWNGESAVQDRIPPMVERLKAEGYAHYDDGALVVDVKEESDTKEIPPCMILKSNGSALYNTTDLATLVMRTEEIDPDEVIYVVDKRQELYFTQVFRCARKTEIVKPDVQLRFLGFGTMNGKDGKPFKTRAGGVMRLENLIREINEEMLEKIRSNEAIDQTEAEKTAEIVGLSAIKYGDLSNQASKDYVFDIDRFTSFEGNTGPYLLYTIVRIKSILRKAKEKGLDISDGSILPAAGKSEKELMLSLSRFRDMFEAAYRELAPHRICGYLYDTANAFNHFYHETKILAEKNEERQKSYLSLLILTKDIMETSIGLLGFKAPDRM